MKSDKQFWEKTDFGFRVVEIKAEDVPLEIQREIASDWHTDYINGHVDFNNPFDTWKGM